MFAVTYSVPRTGVEPAQPFGYMALNHARLPIPPPGLLYLQKTEMKNKDFNSFLFFILLFVLSFHFR